MSAQSAIPAAPLPGHSNPEADNLGSTQVRSIQMTPATAVPTSLSVDPSLASPTFAPLPAPRGRRAISLREVLLGYADLPGEVVARIEASDRQRAIYPDTKGGLTTIPEGVCDQKDCTSFGTAGEPCTRKKPKPCEGSYKGIPMKMGPMAAEWLNEEIKRRWFKSQGVSPYGGLEKGPQQKKPGDTSAFQNEDTGGWAQHKAAYDPAKEREKQFTGAEGKQNRMRIVGLK